MEMTTMENPTEKNMASQMEAGLCGIAVLSSSLHER